MTDAAEMAVAPLTVAEHFNVTKIADLAKNQMRVVIVVEHFVAEISQAEHPGLDAGGKYFRICSVRLDSEHPWEPMCWTDVFASEKNASVIPLATER